MRKQERKGEKRVWDQTPEKGRPDKRQRDTSPEPLNWPPEWMEPPTFLTSEEKKARDKFREGQNQGTLRDLKLRARSPEVPQKPDPKPQRSTKTPVRD